MAWLLVALGSTPALSDAGSDDHVRVLSWNISDDSFVSDPDKFRALLREASAQILLLDEIRPDADVTKLHAVLTGLQPDENSQWNIDYGVSGGRQRAAIASELPLESLTEFDVIIPYPASDRDYILQNMTAAERGNPDFSMDEGIPVNAAVVVTGPRRLLVLSVDLQCCGNDPASWQEYRRRAEARVIRETLDGVLERIAVDGVIIAGDFNVVSTPVPMGLLAGPYNSPHFGLVQAEAYHSDGITTWTWDGRGTPFPSRAMDFQMYSPASLQAQNGSILYNDYRLSRHLPVVIDYTWRQTERSKSTDGRQPSDER